MKKIGTLLSVILLLSGCGGGRPVPPTKTTNSDQLECKKNVSAPTIKVYVENSGSMYGYTKGVTDFENSVYSYLSDLQYADLGQRKDSLSLKNDFELNYINSKVLPQKPDIRAFIESLEPVVFKMKGGNGGVSDMALILQTILSRTGTNDVSLLISDCIFSPGKQYKLKDNADEYIVAQQICIKGDIIEKLSQQPNFGMVVMQLSSQFNGIYYNKFDDKQHIQDKRPFYIWLMGDVAHLKRILEKVNIQKIKGQGVQRTFMISQPDKHVDYFIGIPKPGMGKYKLDNVAKSITNVEVDERAGQRKLQIILNADFSKLLLSDDYLLDPSHYRVSNNAYSLEIEKNSTNNGKYTHTLKLNLQQPTISKGHVKISLLSQLPSWVEEFTDEIGVDILAPGAMEKTYGLKYLLGGVYDAYADSEEYGVITLNID